MPHDVLNAIKPWVKAFSAEIPYKYKHGDDVCIGGIVKEVLNLTDLFDDEGTRYEGFAYLYVDDDIGDMVLQVPREIYDDISKEYEIKEGTIVLAEGKVLKPSKGVTSGIDIICWNVYPLSSKKTETQEE